MWAGTTAIIVFLAAWAWSGSFWWSLFGSYLLWALAMSVGEPFPDSRDGPSTSIPGSSGSGPGLLGIVLVVAGLSCLFGGGGNDGEE